MARRQFLYSIHQRPRARNVVQRKIAVQPFHTEAAVHFRMDQDRLELRAKEYVLAVPGDVEWLDSHAVTGQNEPPGRLAPQGDGKHSPQARKASYIPRQKCV